MCVQEGYFLIVNINELFINVCWEFSIVLGVLGEINKRCFFVNKGENIQYWEVKIGFFGFLGVEYLGGGKVEQGNQFRVKG